MILDFTSMVCQYMYIFSGPKCDRNICLHSFNYSIYDGLHMIHDELRSIFFFTLTEEFIFPLPPIIIE